MKQLGSAIVDKNATKAFDAAKRLAKLENVPYSIWRHGDAFIIIPEGEDPAKRIKPVNIIRPVATIDPDGTEYS